MFRMNKELQYTLRLPFPPAFKLRQDQECYFQVPEFYGFESPATRWIITMLTNKCSIKRLIKCGKTNEDIFSRFYQIPDRPIDIMGSDFPLENPAYHQQCVLYLTPLALAIYLKQAYAVEMLLRLSNDEGRKIIHPAEPCFVQKVYRKGDNMLTNELCNSFPVMIAIRRNFYEGVSLLSQFGFSPQRQFSVLQRESYRETIVIYRDIVDYLTELLRIRPGLNVTKFLRIVTDPSLGLTTFDIFVFDLELTTSNKWDYVSIFRRVCRAGLSTRFFIEESGTQLLNMLEQIQTMGYFCGSGYLKIYYNGAPPSSNEKPLDNNEINAMNDERISIIMDKVPTVIKATRDDILELSEEELSVRLNYDYQCCVAMLFLMYQRCLNQEKAAQYLKICKLLSKIVFDIGLIKSFFNNNDHELSEKFTTWSIDEIKVSTVRDFRIRMQDYLMFTESTCINFINKFGEVPHRLIKAPLVHNRHPEDSPIIRELLYISKSYMNKKNEAQNTNMSNPCIFNIMNNNSEVTLKLIPANYARIFNFDSEASLNSVNVSNFSKPLNFKLNRDNVLNEKRQKMERSNSIENNDEMKESKEFLPPKPDSKNKNVTGSKIGKKNSLNRSKSSQDIRSKKLDSNVSNNNVQLDMGADMKKNLMHIMATNEKFKDIKIDEMLHFNSDADFPLQFLRPEIEKLDNAMEVIKMIQHRPTTKKDNLYENYCAATVLAIMKELVNKTNLTKLSNLNSAIYQVFQNSKKTEQK